jgi:nucleotide-binding universal stress UspA family protein
MSQKYGEILVGIDGSLPAQRVAELAIQIAAHLNLSIRGLHVVDQRLVMDWYTDNPAESDGRQGIANRTDRIDQLEVQGEACLAWLEKQCRHANVSMTGDLFIGGVTEVLCQEAANVNLVALGKRGNGHTKKAHTLGSNFRNIISRVRQPILVGGEEERPLKRILFIEKSSRDISKTLDSVARLQNSIHGEVIGLDIQKSNIAMQAGLCEIMTEFHKIGITDYRLAGRPGWSVAEIVASAREYSADLVVIRKDRSPAMIKWLTGSTMEDFIEAMPLPVLLIHEYGLFHNLDCKPERDKNVVHS